MDEVYCNDYNWELFFRISTIIVPKLLKKAHRQKLKFCVIGGKAVDAHTASPAYSENYIGSPDWDIDVDDKKKFEAYIKTSIEQELPFVRINSEKVDKFGEKGVKLGIKSDKCLLHFMDIFQVSNIKYELIDGIPYLPRQQLMIQLFQILSDRRKTYDQDLAFVPDVVEINSRIEEARKNITKSKSKLMKAVKKLTTDEATIEKIEEFANSIEDYTKMEQSLIDAGDSKQSLDFDLKIQKSLQKLEKTKKRLQTLAEQNRGYVSEVCQDCSKNIGKTIDSVSCNTINKECAELTFKFKRS
jgi:urease gamma subunit